MKLIQLNETTFTKVDDEDYPRLLEGGRWYLDCRGIRQYASRHPNGKKEYMHRSIINAETGFDVDHIDGDGLNNQKSNLRQVTRSANNHNRHNPRIDNSSGVSGVYFCNHYQSWKAEIKVLGKKVFLGSFARKDFAVEARKIAEDRLKNGLSARESYDRKRKGVN